MNVLNSFMWISKMLDRGATGIVAGVLETVGLKAGKKLSRGSMERVCKSASASDLIRLKEADRLLEIEFYKLKLADIQNARDMQIKSKNKMVPLMGFFILGASFLALTGLFFVQFPEENRDLVNIVIGLIVGHSANVVTFYFGSSDNKR